MASIVDASHRNHRWCLSATSFFSGIFTVGYGASSVSDQTCEPDLVKYSSLFSSLALMSLSAYECSKSLIERRSNQNPRIYSILPEGMRNPKCLSMMAFFGILLGYYGIRTWVQDSCDPNIVGSTTIVGGSLAILIPLIACAKQIKTRCQAKERDSQPTLLPSSNTSQQV